jgi:hypothetical protein
MFVCLECSRNNSSLYSREKKKDFTAKQYGPTYNGILVLIEKLRQDSYHWEKFTAARHAWAGEAK